MWKYRGFLAKLFFVIFLFSLILSYFFGMACLNHNCIGEECNICYEINLMKNIFDNLLILSLIFCFIKSFEDFIFYIKDIFRKNYSLTLVKLKVMLLE